MQWLSFYFSSFVLKYQGKMIEMYGKNGSRFYLSRSPSSQYFKYIWLRTPSVDAPHGIFLLSFDALNTHIEAMKSVCVYLCDNAKKAEKQANVRNNHKHRRKSRIEIWTKTKEKCWKLTQTQQGFFKKK